jgi:hypothetical protein
MSLVGIDIPLRALIPRDEIILAEKENLLRLQYDLGVDLDCLSNKVKKGASGVL